MCNGVATCTAGKHGLPLHLALGCRQVVPESICSDLLEAYPESARVADRAGKLPLHYVAEFNSCSVVVFKMLLDYYPEAASQPNKWGQVSSQDLHCSAHVVRAEQSLQGAGSHPMHTARTVMRSHRNAAWAQLPIHYACWRRAPAEVISMLYDAYPEGATLTDTLAGFAPYQETLR